MRRKCDAAYDTSTCDYNNDEMQYGPEISVEATLQYTNVPQETVQRKMTLQPSTTIEIIAMDAHYLVDNKEQRKQNIELELLVDNVKTYPLNEHPSNTRLSDLGIEIDPRHTYTVVVTSLTEKRDMSAFVGDNGEDDLLLGASASPTAGEIPSGSNSDVPHSLEEDYPEACCLLPCQLIPENVQENELCEPSSSNEEESAVGTSNAIEANNYVGLVNQAMTCYLNSLVQALFMTPEFRNAIYNWEFDGQNEARSIPYQLQKLFLNLQTSTRSAVETTDLTTSFGWQGSDAWQQHDIQELCRVMFDALERKFKCTKQANLINDLYEGTMLDYVKCLECGREKSRQDTFLDIPLPVRPFGNAMAYNSIEEALRGFVLPETLEGNNQYFCEKCNKKCDAHKGLKFIKFPYLLTLHLKRFDFDYNTMHRIKLNDKVVFPEKLNLNSFVPNNRSENEVMEDRENIVKCDDCSTTDSGSALDDESCQGTDASSAVNEHDHDDNCEDSDEGIDVSSGNAHQENEAKGPYIYELFSIMIHSGSASGGHYYAYIKDFDHNQWLCFNDQSVNKITQDDIQKTYGGGSQKSYYPGAYTSSTNAYMLMYRQIDPERNCSVMKVDEFPPHMQKLLQHMREREHIYRLDKEKQNNSLKLTVYCYHPITGELNDIRLNLYSDSTLETAAIMAHKRFKLEGLINVDDCRMVVYNRKQSCIDCSFETDDLKFCDIVDRYNAYYSDWFLEIREPGTEFKVYKGGGVDMRVYYVDIENEELREPFLLRVDVTDTVGLVRQKLSESFCMDVSKVKLAIEKMYYDPQMLTDDNVPVPFDTSAELKLFACNNDEEPEVSFLESKFYKTIKRFDHIVHIGVLLPDTDPIVLNSCYIPSLDSIQSNIERLESDNKGTSSPVLRVSPQPQGLTTTGIDTFGDQSNSEDSSLSDSDRTLIGDAPGECQCPFSSNANSPADQHMTSPMDPTEDDYNYDVMGNPAEEMNWDNSLPSAAMLKTPPYFKLTSACECNRNLTPETTHTRLCRVFVETRMTLETFKKHLEPIIRVPKEYFKVYRQSACIDEEWSCLSDTLNCVRDGHTLVIRLGRALSINEVNCKIYLLKPDSTDVDYFLFDFIVTKGLLVGHVKRDILLKAKKQHMLDIAYHKCRLREKYLKRPRKIYLDDQFFGSDITVLSNGEMYLQQLSDVDKVKSVNQLVVFVRHWCPSTLTLDTFKEIVLDNVTPGEFKSKLSEMSDIPLDNVQFAFVKTAFPCDMHLLEIDLDLDWDCDQMLLQADDGSTFFYKDNREKLKELSSVEKKELNIKENQRLGRCSSRGAHSSERSLRIYLDSWSDADDMD